MESLEGKRKSSMREMYQDGVEAHQYQEGRSLKCKEIE